MAPLERPRTRFLRWLAAIVYLAGLLWLGLGHRELLPHWFPHMDKLLHFLGYTGLGFVFALALPPGRQRRRFWIAFPAALVIGFLDELHQKLVPGLDFSAHAFLADAAGAWAGSYLYLKSETVIRRSRR